MSLMTLNAYSNFSDSIIGANHHKLMLRHTIHRSNSVSDNSASFSQQKFNHTTTSTPILVTSYTSKTKIFNTAKTSKTTKTITKLKLEKQRKEGFWFRKWDSLDLTNLCWHGSMHVLAACAPFVFNWGAFWVAMVLLYFTGTGVTLGYHRLLAHRSFKVPKWLEYFFAYCGAHALQRDPIFWVSIHKHHHKSADTERDPHSPSEGFWFSYMGWFMYNDYLATKCGESKSGQYSNVEELKKQTFYRFLHDTYFWHLSALATFLYFFGGFPYLAWGMGMRTVVALHITFLGTSVLHLWGERPWKLCDTSTNNWWVAILTLGDGWHNNHHAFPKSARHGLEWWQVDMNWQVINILRMAGLATNVHLPTDAEKRSIKNDKSSLMY